MNTWEANDQEDKIANKTTKPFQILLIIDSSTNLDQNLLPTIRRQIL
jgi:hypothetical protein